MTKNDFKKLVPDVMCQDLVVTVGNPATLGDKARHLADMMVNQINSFITDINSKSNKRITT